MDPRAWWQLYEPYHAVVYFAPEAKQAYAAAGLKGGWMGYFASRAAALGPVPAEVVIATFYNFHPAMVRRAIPDAWGFSSPERVLAARFHIADASLRRVLGDLIEADDLARAAAIARAATERCDPAGRPLFAAHSSLAWPDEAHLALWHASTLLREHRGDGHVTALIAHGVGPLEAHILQAAVGKVDRIHQRTVRGWTDEDWDSATADLAARAWIGNDGALRDAGRDVLERVEAMTDRLAEPPFTAMSERDADHLAALLRTARERIAAGAVPYPNPIGVPEPPE